jgi:hypothetical protein
MAAIEFLPDRRSQERGRRFVYLLQYSMMRGLQQQGR